MAICQRGQQSTINESRNRNVMRCGTEVRDDFVAFDEALQLMSLRIIAPASETVREIVGIEILNCLIHTLPRPTEVGTFQSLRDDLLSNESVWDVEVGTSFTR